MALNDSQKRVLAAMRTDFIAPLALLEHIVSKETDESTKAKLGDTLYHLCVVIEDLDTITTGSSTLLDGVGL